MVGTPPSGRTAESVASPQNARGRQRRNGGSLVDAAAATASGDAPRRSDGRRTLGSVRDAGRDSRAPAASGTAFVRRSNGELRDEPGTPTCERRSVHSSSSEPKEGIRDGTAERCRKNRALTALSDVPSPTNSHVLASERNVAAADGPSECVVAQVVAHTSSQTSPTAATSPMTATIQTRPTEVQQPTDTSRHGSSVSDTLRQLDSVQAVAVERLERLHRHLQTLHRQHLSARNDVQTSEQLLKSVIAQRTSVLEPTLEQIVQQCLLWKDHAVDCRIDLRECQRRLEYVQNEHQHQHVHRDLQFVQEQHSIVASNIDDAGHAQYWSQWFSFCGASPDCHSLDCSLQTTRDWELQLHEVREDHRKLTKRHARVRQTIQFWRSQDRQQSWHIQQMMHEEIGLVRHIQRLQQHTIPSIAQHVSSCKAQIFTVQNAYYQLAALQVKYRHTQAVEDADQHRRQIEDLKRQLQASRDEASWWKDTSSSLEERMDLLEQQAREAEHSAVDSRCQAFTLKNRVQLLEDDLARARTRTEKLESQLRTIQLQKNVLDALQKEGEAVQSNDVASIQHEVQQQIVSLTEQLQESRSSIERLVRAQQEDTSPRGTDSALAANQDTVTPMRSQPPRLGIFLEATRKTTSATSADSLSGCDSVSSSASGKSVKVVALRQRMKELEGQKEAISVRLHKHKSIDEHEKKTSEAVIQSLRNELEAVQSQLFNERQEHAVTQKQVRTLAESTSALESRCKQLEEQARSARKGMDHVQSVLLLYLSSHGKSGGTLEELLKELSVEATVRAMSNDKSDIDETKNVSGSAIESQQKGIISIES